MTLLAERPTRQAMTHTRPPEFRLRSEMQFAALPTAIVCTQLFARFTLDTWRLDELIAPTEQLVTELVSRAVRTTGITDPHPQWVELDDLKLIVVRLIVVEHRLLIEVVDTDPVFSTGDDDSLVVVPSLSKRWNYYLPPTGGKVVWCELLLPASSSALDVTQEIPRLLPRRVPKPVPGPAGPLPAMHDPAVLRRVWDGLHALDDDPERR